MNNPKNSSVIARNNPYQIELNTQQFQEYIDWIEMFDALEIHRISRRKKGLENEMAIPLKETWQTDLMIPYLMNDCVESILTIHDCVFSSPLQEDSSQGQTASSSEESILLQNACFLDVEGTDDLVLQLPDRIVSLRYDYISIETHCYQYHSIGHNWRKTKGEEPMRRLVNLICILYDKYRYLGEKYTNEIEQVLAPLIEFAPFSWWSPINSSMLEWYSETPDGIRAMKEIAREAEDSVYYELLCQYEQMPLSSSQRKMHARILSQNLLHPDHIVLYQTILDKITAASLQWEPRQYEPEQQHKIEAFRQNVIASYQSLGYEGTYPHFRKWQSKSPDSSQGLWHFVNLVEQQPFTKLEAKGYHFRMYAMESTGPDPVPPCSDYGFFHEVQKEGWNSHFQEHPLTGRKSR